MKEEYSIIYTIYNNGRDTTPDCNKSLLDISTYNFIFKTKEESYFNENLNKIIRKCYGGK